MKKNRLEEIDIIEATGYKIRYHPKGASRDLFLCKEDEVLISGPAGCLSGDTLIQCRRGSRHSSRRMCLSEFYLKFNGYSSGTLKYWDSTLPTYLHSLGDDSVMFYNRVVTVIQSGIKQTVRVVLGFGSAYERNVVATPDHPFMTSNGFIPAGNLPIGSKVMCRGSMESRGWGGRDLSARPPRVIVDTKYHPFGWSHMSNGYEYFRIPRARLVIEAEMNNLPYDEYVHALKHNPFDCLGFTYLPSDLEAHHMDENTLNDDIGNLMAISKAEHARIHNQKGNFNFDSTVEVEVSKIEEDGEEMTYDIQMESPSNNFCANGVVVHNTGKSLSALHKVHLCLSKYPGAKAFMARKTRTSMTNSCMATFQNHVIKPPDRVKLHKQDQVFNYPNGSMLAVIGLDDPERIKSTDWDLGFIQEVTECTENDWEICTTRLRNWVMPYQQMLADCNPDKPTHWMKRRCDKGLTKQLVSHHEDNPKLWNEYEQAWTPEGQKYMGKLQRLSGVRRSRLYQGLWVAAEGLVYDQWDAQIHMVNLADLPKDWVEWPHYWSIDWGFIHPICWQDWIESPHDGSIYLYRQIYRTETLVEDLARMVMEVSQGYIPRAIICDHDAGDRATFERHTGYLTLPAYKSIQPGIQAVQARIKPLSGGPPKVFIIRDSLLYKDERLVERGLPTCTEEEMDGYIWDKKITRETNSKKDELPVDKDNHGMDGKRYMIAFLDNLADDPEEFEGVVVHNEEDLVISPY